MRTFNDSLHSAVIAAAVFALVHVPGSGHASRPFVTEHAAVAEKRAIQLETSWDYLKWRNNDREHFLTVVALWGMCDAVELSFEVPFLFHDHVMDHRANGLGDITIATKYLLADERDAFPALVLKTVLKTSTGDARRGLGSGALDYLLVGATTKQFRDLTLHGMLGYTFVGTNGNDDLRDVLLYGIAAEFEITERICLAAELAGNRHPDRRVAQDPHVAMIGAAYKFSDAVTLDASLRVGISTVSPAWNTAVGMSVTL